MLSRAALAMSQRGGGIPSLSLARSSSSFSSLSLSPPSSLEKKNQNHHKSNMPNQKDSRAAPPSICHRNHSTSSSFSPASLDLLNRATPLNQSFTTPLLHNTSLCSSSILSQLYKNDSAKRFYSVESIAETAKHTRNIAIIAHVDHGKVRD